MSHGKDLLKRVSVFWSLDQFLSWTCSSSTCCPCVDCHEVQKVLLLTISTLYALTFFYPVLFNFLWPSSEKKLVRTVLWLTLKKNYIWHACIPDLVFSCWLGMTDSFHQAFRCSEMETCLHLETQWLPERWQCSLSPERKCGIWMLSCSTWCTCVWVFSRVTVCLWVFVSLTNKIV